MYMKLFQRDISKKRGFALLFSVLVSGILLSIGLGIFSITYKELLLSFSDRESQVAFYAADTGTECALYWDIKHPDTAYSVFGLVLGEATSSPAADDDDNEHAWCAEEDIVDGWTTTYDSGKPSVVTTFTLDNIGGNGSCAEVTVTKEKDYVNAERTTRIDSRGFNTCDPNASRRAERGLRVEYSI